MVLAMGPLCAQNDSVVKTKKDDVKEPVVEKQPDVKEEPLEADEYTEEIKPRYVQRTVQGKTRKDRKKK